MYILSVYFILFIMRVLKVLFKVMFIFDYWENGGSVSDSFLVSRIGDDSLYIDDGRFFVSE